MAAIIAAIEPRKPPEDARSSAEIADILGVTRQRVNEYVSKARKRGVNIESVGKFGGVMYYRIKP